MKTQPITTDPPIDASSFPTMTKKSRVKCIRTRIADALPWIVLGLITGVSSYLLDLRQESVNTDQEAELDRRGLWMESVEQRLLDRTRDRVYRSEIESIFRLNPELKTPSCFDDASSSD